MIEETEQEKREREDKIIKWIEENGTYWLKNDKEENSEQPPQ